MYRRRGNPMALAGRAVRSAGRYVAGYAAGTAARKVVQTAAKSAKKHFKYGSRKPKKSAYRNRKIGKHYFTTDKIQEDIGTGGQEITSVSRTVRFKGCGKRIRRTKLEKATSESQIFRIQGISPFMNTNVQPLNVVNSCVGAGAYWLKNFTSATSNLTCPLHVWDITCITNTQNGQVSQPQPGYELQFNSNNNPGAGITFQALKGFDQNGLAQNPANWVPENIAESNNSYNVYPEKAGLQEWVDINLLTYGCANQATKFKICLFQTKEDLLAPLWVANTIATNQFDPQRQLAVNTYEAMVSPFIKHPINTQYYNKMGKESKIKYLYELDYVLQPRLTTETDNAVGHCKKVHLHIPLNRINRYDWAQYNTDGGSVTTATTYISQQGHNDVYLHPKARVYLGIMALNTSNVVGAGIPNVNFTPSYDMVLRTRYTTLG